MASSNCCFLTCIQISHEAGKVVWYSQIFKILIFHSLLWFTQSKTVVVNESEVDVFLEFSCFFCMIQQLLQNDDFFSLIIVSRHIRCNSHRKQIFPSSTVWLLLLFSHLVVPGSLWPHGLQHARPPCPSLSHEVCPSSRPFHQWRHPAISSSDTLFSSCFQSFPASETFPLSLLFVSGDQNTGTSALASVLPMNIQGWFPLGLTGLILLNKGLSGVFSRTIWLPWNIIHRGKAGSMLELFSLLKK